MNEGVDWHPQLFRRVQGGNGGSEEGEEDLDWIINAKVSVCHWVPTNISLTFGRDGKSPQEQVKQILEIAAILPGQAPHRKFSIPALSRTNTNDPAAAGNQAIQQTHQIKSNTQPEVSHSEPDLPQQKQQTFGDLIDLSDPTPNKDVDVNANNPKDPSHLPLDKPKSQPENLNPEKKSQDEFSEDLPPSKLLNFVRDEPGQGNSLKRTDTETEEEEQFHDAHS